jgi:hypothetical protein
MPNVNDPATTGPRFGSRAAGNNDSMTVAFLILLAIALITAVTYLGLLLWGAIEDGRDQERRDRERLHGH